MQLFFDLDGTLLDSRPRLFHLFTFLVPKSHFTFDEYWDLKRQQIGHKEILTKYFQATAEEIALFEDKWMTLIEAPEWLSYDKPFDGIDEYLKNLKKEHKLYVVTARQFTEAAETQIRSFGWENIFSAILVTCQVKEKHELMSVYDIEPTDWFIGDTGKDVQAGKELGMRTAAVLSGFRSLDALSKYKPDIIANNVLELKFTN